MPLCPAEPFARRVPDEAYTAELRDADERGLATRVLDFEALDAGDVTRAQRWVPRAGAPGMAAYSGWMTRPEVYAALFVALLERGSRS